MNNQVIVTAYKAVESKNGADATLVGKVIIPSVNKPEMGYIRVESECAVFENGFANIQKRSALIKGKLAELTRFDFKEGQKLPGKLIVIETTVKPFDTAQPKINPSTSEVIKSIDGKEIYRDCIYTTDMSKQDVLVETVKSIVNVGSVVAQGAA